MTYLVDALLVALCLQLASGCYAVMDIVRLYRINRRGRI